MSNLLDGLKSHSIIVADTGDFESIRKYQPRDATTNPSLLLKAAQMEEYQEVVEKAVADAKQTGGSDTLGIAMDNIATAFGAEILKIVPNRVSTEVDAKLSFDTAGTVAKAKSLISLYEKAGIERERILIKIASTWEGIRAAEQLKADGINCNLTLLFSFAQAVACAEAGVRLISPFVGRILDWHKANTEGQDLSGANDPGVQSVTRIYNYYKKHGYDTEVMGASFRNVGEILELAGSDLLTISPALLEEMAKTKGDVSLKLDPATADEQGDDKIEMNENIFRWMHNEDAMATDKLADGIRRFAADTVKLEKFVTEKLEA